MAGQQSLIKLFFLWGWEIVRGDFAPWVLPCASSLGCCVFSASHVLTTSSSFAGYTVPLFIKVFHCSITNKRNITLQLTMSKTVYSWRGSSARICSPVGTTCCSLETVVESRCSRNY